MISIRNYKNPFNAILDFENKLADYTSAPYVVTTDCCTHAIELCFRYKQFLNNTPHAITIPKQTYISVPMVFHKLNIPYVLIDNNWRSEYNFGFTNVWDSARILTQRMYRPGQMQCLSFGRTKPLEVGRGGAILLDDKKAYNWLKRASYDGRDLNINPWQDQKEFQVGYHYTMRPEECIDALNKLNNGEINNTNHYSYPDISKCTITQK